MVNSMRPDDATPASKVHGANVGPSWVRQDPGGPHVGPMNFVIWDMAPEILVNTGSGNGLLLEGTKSLPEPKLTYHL